MTNTNVKLKEGYKVNQPMASNPWRFGYIDGYIRGADNVPYAVVVTEYNELELVPINLLIAY